MHNLAEYNPELITEAINGFYYYLENDPKSQQILGKLTSEELTHVKERQRTHWQQLVKPTTDRLQLHKSAKHVGKIHAILGIPTASIANGGSFFQRVLFDAIHRLKLPQEQNQQLIDTIASRIQDETEIQLAAIDEYYQQIDTLIHATIKPTRRHLWADKRQERLNLLTSLDGIAGALWLGRNQHNDCVVEASSFAQEDVNIHNFIDHYLRPTITNNALNPKTIEVYNISQLDIATSNHPKGIRSLTIRPVFDLNNHHFGWLVVLGMFPAMFMGIATKRLIDISVAQFKVDALHHPQSNKGKSELAIRQLKRYLYGGHLSFHYQPIIHLSNGLCAKFEALARLHDDSGKLISPGEFLPYFGYDEMKFIFIDGLRQAFEQLNAWQKQGYRFDVSVNLPPELLIDPLCVNWIASALKTHQIAPNRLHLELLETEESINTEQRNHAILALNELGVCLKMDDLGAGHSGLVRLKELPFAGIKIDQSLVRDLESDKALKVISIIDAMLSLANKMQLSSIVEGLETPAEIETVAILGAELGQGYYIAKPMPANQVLDWLTQFNWTINIQQPQSELAKLVMTLRKIDKALEKERLNTDHSCQIEPQTEPNGQDTSQYDLLCHHLADNQLIKARQLAIKLIHNHTQQ